jgi:hypothetical protein
MAGYLEHWLYFVQIINQPDSQNRVRIVDVNNELNNLGREGWELVTILQKPSGEWIGFFKQKLVI